MGMHIVVTGNPIDGLSFIGPFKTAEEASRYASFLDEDWWVAPLEGVEE